MLAGLQRRVTISGVGGRGIPGHEHLRCGRCAQRGIDDDPSEGVALARHVSNEARSDHARRQHHRVGVEGGAGGEGHAIGRERGDGLSQAAFDRGRREGCFDLRARSGAEFGADRCGAIDEDDAQVLRLAAVGRDAVTQFERQLDPGEAGSDDGNRRTRDIPGDLLQSPVEDDGILLAVD